MGWTIEQKRRYANAMHHLDNVMFEMRQCIDTPNGDEVGIYNSANELRKKVESESQKAETSDEALPISDVVKSLPNSDKPPKLLDAYWEFGEELLTPDEMEECEKWIENNHGKR